MGLHKAIAAGRSGIMTRKESRELAFVLIFEKSFRDESIEEIIETAVAERLIETDDYSKKVPVGVFNNIDEIDRVIADNLKGWTIGRLSRVALSVLRLSVYEIKYMDDIPNSVSINEAVELTKKFASEEDAAYINGVLGSVVRQTADA